MKNTLEKQEELKAIDSVSNVLQDYRITDDLIKNLEKQKEALKAQIFNLMDERKTDELCFGNFKAKRALIVQERVDSKKVREIMGDDVSLVLSECEVIKLTVI